MNNRLIDAIQFPTSDTSFALRDAVALATVVEVYGYDQVIAAVQMLRRENGDMDQPRAVSSAWRRRAESASIA